LVPALCGRKVQRPASKFIFIIPRPENMPSTSRHIMGSRRTYRSVAPAASGLQERIGFSQRNILVTPGQQIKSLEARNRELTELLERAYGGIAQT
jgi:hypothetical protein